MIDVLPDDILLLAEERTRESQQVLSDWLIERDDPWGSFIAVADEPKAAAKLWKKHGKAWSQGFSKHRGVELEWRDGFIRSISIYSPQAAGKDLTESDKEAFAALLNRPQSCHLDDVRIFGFDLDWFEACRALVRPRVRVERILPLDCAGYPSRDQIDLERLTELEPSKVRWIFTRGSERPSEAFDHFPNLEVITVNGSWPYAAQCASVRRLASLDLSRDLPIELLELPVLPVIGSLRPAAREFLDDVRDRSVAPRQRLVEANLFRNENIGSATTTDQLLVALDGRIEAVRRRAFEVLDKRLPDHLEEAMLSSGDVVARLGQPNIKTAELTSWFESIGVVLTRRVTKKTTHAIVGHRPKGAHLKLPASVRIILPSHLRNPLKIGTTAGQALEKKRQEAKAKNAAAAPLELAPLRKRLHPKSRDASTAKAVAEIAAHGAPHPSFGLTSSFPISLRRALSRRA